MDGAMMQLFRIGENAAILETSRGAVLFSYGKLTAARRGYDDTVFVNPAAVQSIATRAHIMKLSRGRAPANWRQAYPADYDEFIGWIITGK